MINGLMTILSILLEIGKDQFKFIKSKEEDFSSVSQERLNI